MLASLNSKLRLSGSSSAALCRSEAVHGPPATQRGARHGHMPSLEDVELFQAVRHMFLGGAST